MSDWAVERRAFYILLFMFLSCGIYISKEWIRGTQSKPKPLVPHINYRATAYKKKFMSQHLWSVESFSKEHYMEVIEQVPIRTSQLVHIHHVCLEGGRNGLALPHLLSYFDLGGMENYRPGRHNPAAFRVMDYNDMATTVFPGEKDDSQPGAIQVHGPTFFVNCWNRASDETSPSHWLMRIIKMYEISEVVRSSRDLQLEGEVSPLPLFDHLAFHQCPSYNNTIKSGAWSWGALIMDTATRHWTDAGLWKGPNDIDVIELNKNEGNWTCFEDLYFERGSSFWYPAPQYQKSWLSTLRQTVEDSLPPKSTSSRAPGQGTPPPKASLAERCRTRSLRIHLFNRSSGSTLRTFANLEQVRAVAANFTSVPISVVTVNATTPIIEQMETFRAFDVLVTSHGSQIANIIFSDPETTAIIEILPVVRDLSFRSNAVQANFSSYVVSTGHTPVAIAQQPNAVCEEGRKNMDKHCEYNPQSDLWTCPEVWQSKLTICDTLVDLTILVRNLKGAISSLCSLDGQKL